MRERRIGRNRGLLAADHAGHGDRPGLATGAVPVFTLAMNARATPLLPGGGPFREDAVNNNSPVAPAIAFILTVTTLVLAAGSAAFVQRGEEAA